MMNMLMDIRTRPNGGRLTDVGKAHTHILCLCPFLDTRCSRCLLFLCPCPRDIATTLHGRPSREGACRLWARRRRQVDSARARAGGAGTGIGEMFLISCCSPPAHHFEADRHIGPAPLDPQHVHARNGKQTDQTRLPPESACSTCSVEEALAKSPRRLNLALFMHLPLQIPPRSAP